MYTDGKMLKFFILQRASINIDAKEFTHFFQFLFYLFWQNFISPPFLFFPTIFFSRFPKTISPPLFYFHFYNIHSFIRKTIERVTFPNPNIVHHSTKINFFFKIPIDGYQIDDSQSNSKQQFQVLFSSFVSYDFVSFFSQFFPRIWNWFSDFVSCDFFPLSVLWVVIFVVVVLYVLLVFYLFMFGVIVAAVLWCC